MDEIKEDTIHQTAIKLAEELKNLSIYKSFYSDIQKLVSSPNVKKDDLKQTLQQAMKDKGLDIKLRNTVFHWVRTQNKLNKLDPITSLSKASAQWEKRIHKSLNSMCTDLETSLAKVRSQSEQEEISEKWNELSTYNLDLTKYRPVYAPKDFLEVLITLSGYVPYTKEGEPKWEFAHLPLQVKTLDQLRKIYIEWMAGELLLGVNPNMSSSVPGFATLEAERLGLGERVAALGYAPVIQEYLKKGSPQCLRAKLWTLVLGADTTPQHTTYFKQLKKCVLEVDLMIDKLVFKDVQLTASNDDQYFVFEDLLYQVMLCFSRDSEVLEQLAGNIGTAISVPVRGRHSADGLTTFPPSGVIPFHGFTMYATPFCYLYDDPVQLYYTFRAFYIRYWHRLHYISTHPQVDSLLFDEDANAMAVMEMMFHMKASTSDTSLTPLHKVITDTFKHTAQWYPAELHSIRVVFKWLMRAFSGHLPPDQLLLLWDAILGYDRLEILPLLAVAILSFRKENIFQVNTLQNVDAVLADLSTIPVIPLLQLALMKS